MSAARWLCAACGRGWRAWACLLLLGLALPAVAADSKAQLSVVTLQLNWKHQFQFAGYYAAIEKGYYRDAGFDVLLKEYQDGVDPVDAVLKGNADYGIGASELVLRYAKGAPIVAVAAIL
ncbi:MAG TPA: ABC transporter substrate-binding protein, partial [Burkholderiales bacterium]|nr:ABC transporter substrate-binding protein [Burkholderiales bacterium]